MKRINPDLKSLLSVAKILVPAAIDECRYIGPHDQLIGKTGFGAGVDDDWRFVDEVVALDRSVRSVDVGGGFESGPCGPEKIG